MTTAFSAVDDEAVSLALDQQGRAVVCGFSTEGPGGLRSFALARYLGDCGDGAPGAGEQCDDGNVVDGDGRSPSCAIDPGWTCTGEPSACAPICGDGVVVGLEACDDSNTENGDCCSSTCELEPSTSVCRAAVGDCDVAETCTGSSATCPVDLDAPDGTICDDGMSCTPSSACSGGACIGVPPVCGDGVVQNPCEQCDLGAQNGQPGSGCTSSCNASGRCTVSQQECAVAADCPPNQGCCGNTLVDIGEQCDDGNLHPGDCCSGTCQDEPATSCTPSLCAELGIVGPHVLAASEKLRLTDAKADGTLEKWNKTGDFNLFSGQSVNPAGERVVVAISENDGANGRNELYRIALEPDDCPPATSCFPPNRQGTTWRYRDSRNAADPGAACGFDGATIKKQAGNKIKFQFKGKADAKDSCAYTFPRPSATVLREDIVIGDECATVLLDCRVFGGNRTYTCTPRP